MLEQKTTGVQEYSDILKTRGEAKLGTTYDYLALADPKQYYYKKLKDEDSKYLDDAMYHEALTRGESDELLSLAVKNQQDQSNEMFDQMMKYSSRLNYDQYRLALEYPYLDNETKVERLNQSTGESFGEYTDQEWVKQILDANQQQFDLDIIEENKENIDWFTKTIYRWAGYGGKLLTGVLRAGQDWYNLFEGIGNVLTGKSFLEAYADDDSEVLQQIVTSLDTAIYEFQRDYTGLVNASTGEYSTWGRWSNGMMDSIGYMLPTMLLALGTGGGSTFGTTVSAGAKTFGSVAGATAKSFAFKTAGLTAKTAGAIKSGLFYTQIFSGMVGENVDAAIADGVSVSDLNSGTIVGNALLKTTMQWGVEQALGAVLGFSGLDRLMGADALATGTKALSGGISAGTKLATQASATGLKAVGYTAARVGKDLIKEGLEETFQDMSDGIIDTVFGEFGAGKSYSERGAETLSPSNLLDSFIVGAMTSAVTSLVQTATVSIEQDIRRRREDISADAGDVAIDESGNSYKMGLFQRLNYQDALRTASEWSEVLNDRNSSMQDKVNAAFKLNAFASTVGNIMKTMGTERTQTALQILEQYSNRETAVKDVLSLDDTSYADKIIDNAKGLFIELQASQQTLAAQYNIKRNIEKATKADERARRLADKIKKSVKQEAETLKKGNVTDLTSIVTETATTSKSKSEIDSKLQSALKGLGVEVMVGHNGTAITQSGDVIFVPESLLRQGNIGKIVEGISYKLAVKEFNNAMTKDQKQLLLDQYKKLTKNPNATIDEAVTALLFDRDFYCYMLYSYRENFTNINQNKALQLMATMDKVVKRGLGEQVAKGNLTTRVYKILMDKIRSNMRTGLITFSTQYFLIDLNTVSKSILTDKDIEAIEQEIGRNKNVVFSKKINDISDKSTDVIAKTNVKIDEYSWFDNIIDQMGNKLTPKQVSELKRKIRSKKYADRLDAKASFISLVDVYNYSLADPNEKVVYLPEYTPQNVEQRYVADIKEYVGAMFGADLSEVSKLQLSEIPDSIKQLAQNEGYNLSEPAQRLSFMRYLVQEYTGGEYTVSGDMTSLLRVVPANEFYEKFAIDAGLDIDRYIFDENGVKVLAQGISALILDGIENGTIKTVGDITKGSVNPAIEQIQIVPVRMESSLNAMFVAAYNAIYVNLNSNSFVSDDILHEITHATQELIYSKFNALLFKYGKTDTSESALKIRGAADTTFSNMAKEVADDLYEYIFTNFPTYTDIMLTKFKEPFSVAAYRMVEGEMEAFSRDNGTLSTLGFTYSIDGQYIVSPLDKRKRWALKSPVATEASLAKSLRQDLQQGTRVVRKSRAEQSNLKYFIEKGKPLQLHSSVVAFVENTTKDFDKLPKVLREKIKPSNGSRATLTRADLVEYAATTKHMNQFTYEHLAKDVFNNEDAEALDYSTMKKFQENIESLARVGEVLKRTKTESEQGNYNKKYTAEELFAKAKEIEDASDRVVDASEDMIKLNKLKTEADKHMAESEKLQKEAEALYADGKALSKRAQSTLYKLLNAAHKLAEKATAMNNEYSEKMQSLTERGVEGDLGALYKKEVAKEAKQSLKSDDALEYSDLLNTLFLRYYDGTFASIVKINRIGKRIATNAKEQVMSETQSRKASDESYDTDRAGHSKTPNDAYGGTYNWVDKLRKADVDYEAEVEENITTDAETNEVLTDVSVDEKIEAIEAVLYDKLAKRLKAISEDETMSDSQKMLKARDEMTKYEAKKNEIGDASDEAINNLYLQAVGADMLSNLQYTAPSKTIEKPGLGKGKKGYARTSVVSERYASSATRDNALAHIGDKVTNVVGKISKPAYKNLPSEIKEHFDRTENGALVFNDKHNSLSPEQKEHLIDSIRDFYKQYKAAKTSAEAGMGLRKKPVKNTKEYIQRMTDKQKNGQPAKQVNANNEQVDPSKPKTMREKVTTTFRVNIKEQNFSFSSKKESTATAKKLLATQWSKTSTSKVQGLSINEEQNVSSANDFYSQNAQTLLDMSPAEAQQTAEWFMSAVMENVELDSNEYKTFEAIRIYFLGFVYSETGAGKLFESLGSAFKERLARFLRVDATIGGTRLSVWKNINKLINPVETMVASLKIDGVELTSEEQDALVSAINRSAIDEVTEIQQKILDRIKSEKVNKKNFAKTVTTVRAMSMLSSPLTWLRNKVSNVVLKRLNRVSSKIGSSLFKSKTNSEQLSMLKGVKVDQKTGRIIGGDITPEIQKFINENFIDNKLYDTLLSNITKYSPSDIQRKFKSADGTLDKSAVFADMILKSLYNKYYSDNMFNNKLMNNSYKFIMKMLSDDNYVREAAIRYFGKILGDRKYDLTQGITNEIMTDFTNAVGLAMSDYMHSDNFLNKIERVIAEKGDVPYMVYKLILPFASSSWNWFKAAITYSPIGLARSIVKLCRLEQTIEKAKVDFDAGKTQVSPALTEFLVRRDLGSGIIGTMSLVLGMALAGLGFIKLDDDDYGTPKLKIGNLEIDISDIFGSSSLLVGAGLVRGFEDKGLTWDGVLQSLNNGFDVALDGFFLTDIMTLDLYSDGQFTTISNLAQSVLLSFIPNLVSYAAGMTYSGNKKKSTFWQKLVAKIPFLANVLPDKVDVYTGETGGVLDLLNRVLPYVDIKVKSNQQIIAEGLGLSKAELKGQYEINEESFNLSAKETAELNKLYGQWNAEYITKFLNDEYAVEIKDYTTNKYRTLTYSQMTDAQRKNAIQNIMNTNATYAKIYAWISAGNLYYGSAGQYTGALERGITMYKGTKGFVKK